MPQLTQKDKFLAKWTFRIILAGALIWFGEAFQPFSIGEDVTSYTAERAKGQIQTSAAHKNENEQTAERAAREPRRHVVQKNETVYEIAQRYHVHIEAVRFFNPDKVAPDWTIKPNDVLVIPPPSDKS